MYISPFISPTWLASLKNRKVKEKNLEAIIADFLEESCVRNPVHYRRMDLLRIKREGSSHSDFLMKLEEIFNLVEYDKMTGTASSWRSPTALCRRSTMTFLLQNQRAISLHFLLRWSRLRPACGTWMVVTAEEPRLLGSQYGVQTASHPPIIWTNVGENEIFAAVLDLSPTGAEIILRIEILRVQPNQLMLESLLNLKKLREQRRTRDTGKISWKRKKKKRRKKLN